MFSIQLLNLTHVASVAVTIRRVKELLVLIIPAVFMVIEELRKFRLVVVISIYDNMGGADRIMTAII